jgi:hypothetical protein
VTLAGRPGRLSSAGDGDAGAALPIRPEPALQYPDTRPLTGRPACDMTEFLSTSPRRNHARRHPRASQLLVRALLVALYLAVIAGAFMAGHGGP